jgi:hypothetical protein
MTSFSRVSELGESAFGTAISQNKSVILNENAKKKNISFLKNYNLKRT